MKRWIVSISILRDSMCISQISLFRRYWIKNVMKLHYIYTIYHICKKSLIYDNKIYLLDIYCTYYCTAIILQYINHVPVPLTIIPHIVHWPLFADSRGLRLKHPWYAMPLCRYPQYAYWLNSNASNRSRTRDKR